MDLGIFPDPPDMVDGWWQAQILGFMFTASLRGRCSPNLTFAYFSKGLVQPPTRWLFIFFYGIHVQTWMP